MSSSRKIRINPEYSAQRRSQLPNPALRSALAALAFVRDHSRNLGKVADLGCGKLRHYRLLAAKSDTLFLVDTPTQISSIHVDNGSTYTISQVAESARRRGRKVNVLLAEDFVQATLELDVIFCVAVFDVVPRKTRRVLTRAAAQNLSPEGHLVVIAPRNDSTILQRCSRKNAYLDGYVFGHTGIHTFFHNFRRYDDIVRDCANEGLFLVSDLSRYRQVCLIFGVTKPKTRQGIA